MKSFLIALGIIVLVALGVGAYFAFRNSGADLVLEFSPPPSVLLGQPFRLEANFTNSADRIISNGRLAFVLPPGIAFLGKSPDLRIAEIPVGDLGPGSLNKQTIELIATADPQSVKRVDAKLTYTSSANGRTQIETRAGVDVSIGQPAVSFTLKAPERVFSGSALDLEVSYENNSDHSFDGVTIKVDYPAVFQFQKSSLPPARSNNAWTIGALPKGGHGSFIVSGTVIGPEQTPFAFMGTLAANFGGQSYTMNTQEAGLSISTAPVSVTITANNTADYVARVGESLRYTIAYRNNSATTLENVNISAAFSGELFNFTSAQSNGAFNSIANTFTWNAGNTPSLASLPPGGSGAVTVGVDLRSAFPIRRLSDKNFTLKVRAQVESPTVPEATGAVKTISVANLETKVAGATTIAAKGYFRDAASGILNAGPYPPRVNYPTQYTIHWVIANYATDVSSIRVSAFLQGGAKFTGKVKSSIGTSPRYDASTGEVVWEIANLPATKGVLGAPVEAIFQIEHTPAVNQVGDEPVLMSETRLEAHDAFTNLKLSGSAGEVTTELPFDQTVAGSSHNVQL